MDNNLFVNPGVSKLNPYKPGKPVEELQRELGLTHIIKLASNENPWGSSKAVSAAITNTITSVDRYPDGSGFVLKKAIAKHYHCENSQITLGNGSNDVLELIGRAFLNPSTHAIYSQHAFAVYPLVVQAINAKKTITPASASYGHDLAAMKEAITDDTSVIFIANPNNPTGTWLSKNELTVFLDDVPSHIIVVVDEAYAEYASSTDHYDSLVDCLSTYQNLVITRTFSKIYGLAALRVGYSLSSENIADLLNRVRQPFNTNSFAQAAAIAAIDDQDHVIECRTKNAQQLMLMKNGLHDLGLDSLNSFSNFLCVHFGQSASSINQALLQKGFIVRPVDNYGLPEYLRISIGLEDENEQLLSILKELTS